MSQPVVSMTGFAISRKLRMILFLNLMSCCYLYASFLVENALPPNAGYSGQISITANGTAGPFEIQITSNGNITHTFSAINAPGWFEGRSWDGFHPISGKRQFGIKHNNDGTYTFYTVGVDRLTSWWHSFGGLIIDAFGGDPFESADELWECAQQTVVDFVIDNESNVLQIEPTRKRPQWSDFR